MNHERITSRRTRLRALLAFCMTLPTTPAWAQGRSTPVYVAKVIQRDVLTGKTFVGTVQAARTTTVGSAASERVVEFAAREGLRVRAGQALARLRSVTLEIQLAEARADLQIRRQELDELENGSRPQEIAQTEARMLAAKARMIFAQKDLERVRNLYDNNRAPEHELDTAILAAEEAEQLFLEAQAIHHLTVEGPRSERVEQARARLQAQQQKVLELEDEVRRHVITAPFDGYIIEEHTEVGEWVATGQAVATVAELDTVEVRALVVEEFATNLRTGAEVRVAVPALPALHFIGRLTRIVPQADLRSRSFPVYIQVNNEAPDGQPLLKAGMLANVELPVGQTARALLVPKDAIVLGGPQPAVFVVDAAAPEAQAATVRFVPVQLGVADSGLIQVRGDLEDQQLVVVRGNERLRPGQEVIVAQYVEQPPGSQPDAAPGPPPKP